MKLKTLQWNIGGGKIRKITDDQTDENVYCISDLDYFIEIIKKYNPDIITLQECHQSLIESEATQAKVIADQLKMPYYFNDAYDNSHLEVDNKLSQAVISKFELTDHTFNYYYNPHLELVRPNGEHWTSHDKGISACIVHLENKKLLLKTSHSFPFRRFGVEPFAEELRPLRENMDQLIKPEFAPFLYQGDLNFNLSNLSEFLPETFAAGVKEFQLTEPTTPKGRYYDRVLYSGLTHLNTIVGTTTLTDHYPVYSEFGLIS